MKRGKRYRKYRENMRKWNDFGTWLVAYECPECGEKPTFFFDKYDAVCCVHCDNWIDRPCSDPDCPYCANRPDTPWEALFYQEACGGLGKEYRRNHYQHKNSGAKRHQIRREEYREVSEKRELR